MRLDLLHELCQKYSCLLEEVDGGGDQRLRVNSWDESCDEGGRKVEKESLRIR